MKRLNDIGRDIVAAGRDRRHHLRSRRPAVRFLLGRLLGLQQLPFGRLETSLLLTDEREAAAVL